jgi:VWFA-related protein
VALAVLVVCFLTLENRAQEASPPAQQPIRSSTELVKVDVSVLEKQGNFVGGLDQKNFRVLDNGGEKPIAFFTPVEAPAQVLVMVETSPAVYLIHNEHLFAAYALLDGLATEDEVALATYDQEPHAILAFTPEKQAAAAALAEIQYTIGRGDLNFFDSISTALDWLRPVPGKRALVLLTTGLDSSPHARWDALVQKLRGEDVVIVAVALGGSLRQAGKKKQSKGARGANAQSSGSSDETENPLSFAKADDALRSLAKMTGGRAYFPESANDFVAIYREIASALRHEYLLGITPEHDGKFHSLTVEVVENGGQPAPTVVKRSEYRIFAREGYLAPSP